MSLAFVNGVNLYYEVIGKGFPLIWCHEFSGDYRSWDAQVKFFSRRYQTITYNARGYPPSDVPTEPTAYSQELVIEDLHQLLLYLDIQQAYVGGLSMGESLALNFAIVPTEMVSVGGKVFSTWIEIASTTMVVLAVAVLPSLSFIVTETEYDPGCRVLIKVKVLSLPSPLPLQE